MTDVPDNPKYEPPDIAGDDEELPTDDRIVGRAFRYSLLAMAALAALGLLAWLLMVALRPAPPVPEADARADLDSLLGSSSIAAMPTIVFTDITAAAGIDFTHHSGATGERLLPETMGGGVAWFDYDGDRLPDLLLIDSGPWPEQRPGMEWEGALRLYRNQGNGAFVEVSGVAGLDSIESYGMGVAIADIEGDGDQDIFLTAVGSNRLLRNEGGRFVDITAQAGVAGDSTRWSSSAGFFDFDGDGALDLWVVNYVDWSRKRDFDVDYRLDGVGRAYGPPTQFPGTQSYLYRNLGDGRFTDVSAELGIHVLNPQSGLPMGKGLALLTEDLDGDGWIDVMVANDTVRNFVFRNLGEGRGFEEVGEGWGLGYDRNGMATGAMGIDSARVSDDGSRAIAIGNFANEMSSYYVSQGSASQYADEAMISGMGPASRAALSFGVLFFDADLDARLDLLQANGHVEDEINRVQQSQHYAQPAQLFWNCGDDCRVRFAELPTDRIGDLSRPIVGRGASVADIDADGDLDVLLTQVGGPPLLLRNDQSLGHHWIGVVLESASPNRDALGAEVSVTANGSTQHRRVGRNRSYLSQTDLPLHFGLGSASTIDSIDIRWPDGSEQRIEGIAVDRMHRIVQGEASAPQL